MGTSVTMADLDEILGAPPRTASPAVEAAFRASNRHIKHVELDSHGFSAVEVTRERLQINWWYLADITDPASPASLGASWRVAAGTSRLAPAAAPIASPAISEVEPLDTA